MSTGTLWYHIWGYCSSKNHLQALFTKEIAKELFMLPINSFLVLQMDVCSFCLHHGENKNESLRCKSTDLHPSCSVQTWAAGWESMEQGFGSAPGSSQLCCQPGMTLARPCSSVPPFPCMWKVSLSWSCWFFVSSFQSILTPAAEKSQTLLSMIYPGAWDKSRLPGRNRLPSLESNGVAGGAWLSEVFTSWASKVISVGHHFGLKIDFIRWKWKWTEEMNCEPHCWAYKTRYPAWCARMQWIHRDHLLWTLLWFSSFFKV